jgi:hypothetical protein
LSLSIFKLLEFALDDTPLPQPTARFESASGSRRDFGVSSNGKNFVAQKLVLLFARLVGFTEAGGGSVLCLRCKGAQSLLRIRHVLMFSLSA